LPHHDVYWRWLLLLLRLHSLCVPLCAFLKMFLFVWFFVFKGWRRREELRHVKCGKNVVCGENGVRLP
jgi:hypothetical protein